MTKEIKQQFTLRITQANSTQLVVIIYEMLLCYMDEAKSAIASEDKAGTLEAIRKARGCINELMNSLHMEYEPAPSLMQLYLFCIRRLAALEYSLEPSIIEEVEKVIVPLHEAYERIAVQNKQAPIMNNSQSVYAGLTYGRGDLNENLSDQNRGMRV